MLERGPARPIVLVGFATTVLVIFAVPLLLVTADHRSPYFWHRVGWTVILAALVWGALSNALDRVFANKGKRGGVFGSVPFTTAIVAGYAALSFLVMMIQSTSDEGPGNRYHVAIQIVIAAAAVFLVTFGRLASAGASVGAEPVPDRLLTPSQLAARLRLVEERLASNLVSRPEHDGIRGLHDAVKSLRETIEHSIAHVGRIGESAEYATIAQEVEEICANGSRLVPDEPDVALLQATADKAAEIRGRVRLVGEDLRRL